MRRILAVGLISVSIAAQAHSEDYDWMDGHHACIVENANFATVDGEKRGTWSDAPKSFFVRLTSCDKFAAKHRLKMGDEAFTSSGMNAKQLQVNECGNTFNFESYQVVEAEGLDNDALLPTPGAKGTSLTVQSITSELLLLRTTGFAEYVGTGSLKSDSSAYAWFTLHAHCTLLGE